MSGPITILESEAVEARLNAECREIGEQLHQLAEWVARQPYLNASFDAGVLSAAREIVEGFMEPDTREADRTRRMTARLATAARDRMLRPIPADIGRAVATNLAETEADALERLRALAPSAGDRSAIDDQAETLRRLRRETE